MYLRLPLRSRVPFLTRLASEAKKKKKKGTLQQRREGREGGDGRTSTERHQCLIKVIFLSTHAGEMRERGRKSSHFPVLGRLVMDAIADVAKEEQEIPRSLRGVLHKSVNK